MAVLRESVDCVIVGAGVVGLAVARAMALKDREVVVLEAESDFGTVTSARNSEVIHAGIYYPADSEKARLCAPGRDQLYTYCASRGVPHKRCGKLIIASEDDHIRELERILARGHANGVTELELWPADKVQARAPGVRAAAAIWSPSTGIVDSHQLMTALLGDCETAGSVLARTSPVERVEPAKNGLLVTVGGAEPMQLMAKTVVNAAGLTATALAGNTDGLSPQDIPPMEYAKGSYFTYSGRVPYDTLLYPMPFHGGLGIHLTLDMAGQARFGPDVEWVNEIDYQVDPAARDAFAESVATYWPGVDPDRMQPGYSGVRPKATPNGKDYHDFVFSGPAEHGIDGLFNLFGIDSPGLTSCLAIADHVAEMVEG